jgi:hypothetical protein
MTMRTTEEEMPTPPTSSPPALSQKLKLCLLFCWAIAVSHIWLSDDLVGGGHGEHEGDLRYEGFGEPERGVREGGMRQISSVEGFIGEDDAVQMAGGQVQLAMATQMTQDEPSVNTATQILSPKTTTESPQPQDGTATAAISNDATNTSNATTQFPEAVQPITSNDCCVPAVYKETRFPTDIKCFGTCYNERACNDTSYPFASEEEKNQYPQLQLTLDVRTKLRNRCVTNLTSLSPPVEWCGKTSLDDEYDEKTDSYPPPGCSHTTNGGGSGAFQHVMIFPSAKLAFCGIPKVGITQWVQFLRFVAGAKDYPSVPHYKLDTDFFQFDKLEPSIQKEIWNSEEWTWAAFLRDPAERILSAYLDKAAPGTRAHPDIKEKLALNGTFTFDNFIERMAIPFDKTSCKANNETDLAGMTGLNWCSDPRECWQ